MELSNIDRQNRTRKVMVRLSEAEYQGLMKLVQGLEATRSKLFRKLVREALGAGPELIGQHLKMIGEGVYQLGALGRNLNQQLRLVNSGQVIGQPADLVLIGQVKDQVVKLENEWLMTIKRSKNRDLSHD